MVKKYWRTLVVAVLVGMLLFVAWPDSSTIYFDGTVDQAVFGFNSNGRTEYRIRSSQYSGYLEFRGDETKWFYVVNASMPEDEIQQILSDGYSGWETSDIVFPFDDGIGTLSSQSLMTLSLEVPDGGSFTYDMEITLDEGNGDEDGDVAWNRIVLKNFPEDLIIQLHSGNDIDMKGTAEKIPMGLYRVIGCSSITFYAAPVLESQEESEIGYNPRLKGNLKRFSFTNTEKNTFEISYYAKTIFNEIGHVEMEGTRQDGRELTLEISDIGQYPIPVKLYGQAGELEMGGVSCYPDWKQWVLEKRSELLLSVAGLFIGMAFKKAQEEKPRPKKEGEGVLPAQDAVLQGKQKSSEQQEN